MERFWNDFGTGIDSWTSHVGAPKLRELLNYRKIQIGGLQNQAVVGPNAARLNPLPPLQKYFDGNLCQVLTPRL